jgi:hypothetical protein
MRLQAAALLLSFLSASVCASAQIVDLSANRVPVTELTGPWRFQTGDDPAWSSPAFDDSGWSLLRADKGWSEQGYPGYSGTAWYRIQVAIPAQDGPLALYIPNVDVSCQVFANGRLIGQKGSLPPHPHWTTQARMVYPIPDDAARDGRLLLAVRVWLDPAFSNVLHGGLNPAPRIGEAKAIAQWRQFQDRQVYWENSLNLIELFANSIGALACIFLFVLRREEREYLWYGIYLLTWAILNAFSLHSAFRPAPYYAWQLLNGCLFGFGFYAIIEFYVILFRQARGWLYAAAVLSSVACGSLDAFIGFRPLPSVLTAYMLAILITYSCAATILFRAWKESNRDAGIILLAVSIGVAELLIQSTSSFGAIFHKQWLLGLTSFIRSGITWPFPVFIPALTGDLINLTILVLLIRRYARGRREEERLESELEAARAVQQVLIPTDVPAIPGFQLQTVYKPASEVGGDFFQIIPVAAGGALIAIGDVSGKGMPAAMTVSLLVGTFRTLAHYTQSPAEILRAMNQRMLARSRGGFTTCLVVRLDSDGILTMANAGHLAPYIGGHEIDLESGLPLGLSADSTYAETQVRLDDAEILTVLTDGVVEARNPSGELFGFERTAAIASEPAERIVQAAQAFGQEDDITVLTVAFAGAGVARA